MTKRDELGPSELATQSPPPPATDPAGNRPSHAITVPSPDGGYIQACCWPTEGSSDGQPDCLYFTTVQMAYWDGGEKCWKLRNFFRTSELSSAKDAFLLAEHWCTARTPTEPPC